MAGFLLLYICVIGIGALIPLSKELGFPVIGLRFVLGFLTLPAIFFLLHVGLKIELIVSCYFVAGLALIGLITEFWKTWNRLSYKQAWLHPIIIFPIIILVLIQNNGGVGYIPYSGDEFSAWLTIPKQTFALGEYNTVKMRTSVPDYAPSWFMSLVFVPLLLGENFNEGMIGLAPLVFHIGLLCLVFDLIRKFSETSTNLSPQISTLISWAFILLFMVVESSGHVIPKNLLIEQPQIYSYLVVFFLFIASTFPWVSRISVYKLIGVIIALSFFLKAAAILFIPVILFAIIFLPTFKPKKSLIFTSRNKLSHLIYLGFVFFCPFVICYLLLQELTIAEKTVSGRPFMYLSSKFIQQLFVIDILKITEDLILAIWDYLSTYKVLLTIFSVSILFISYTQRSRRDVIFLLGLFFVVYCLALYWVHLTVFIGGPAGVPRYMRVVIQVVHSSSLFLFGLFMIDLLDSAYFKKSIRFFKSEVQITSLVLIIFVATLWEIAKGREHLIDISERLYQPLPPYTLEIKKEAEYLAELIDLKGSKKVNILLINHPNQRDIHKYAWYHLVSKKFSQGLPNAKLTKFEKWPNHPSDQEKRHRWRDRFFEIIKTIDVIWPVETIDSSGEIFSGLDISKDCKLNPKHYFILRTERTNFDFVCVKKF